MDIKTGLVVTHSMLHFQFLMQKEKGRLHVKPLALPTGGGGSLSPSVRLKSAAGDSWESREVQRKAARGAFQSCQAQTQGSVQSFLVIPRSLSYQKDSGDASLAQGSYLVSLNAPAEGQGGFSGMGEIGSESHAGTKSKSACKISPKADRELVQGH